MILGSYYVPALYVPRVPLFPCRHREALACGAYQSSGALVAGPCFIVHLQACLRCTGRIWAVLGEFWRVWDNRALFLPNLAPVKIWGRTRSPGKRPPNFRYPRGGGRALRGLSHDCRGGLVSRGLALDFGGGPKALAASFCCMVRFPHSLCLWPISAILLLCIC